jgi:DNA-binding transcriptional LysR family regulator
MLHAATTLYLAGPMTGLLLWNFPAFREAAAHLRAAGYKVWSPAERDLENGFDPASDGASFDLRAALEADVAAVLDGDGIALLPGWEASPGVMVEILTAEGAGLPYRSVEEWLDLAESVSA